MVAITDQNKNNIKYCCNTIGLLQLNLNIR